MTKLENCPSRLVLFGDVFPCHKEIGHKGKHKFSYLWTDKEARISGTGVFK